MMMMMSPSLSSQAWLVSIACLLAHCGSGAITNNLASLEIESDDEQHLCFAQLFVGTKLVKSGSTRRTLGSTASSSAGLSQLSLHTKEVINQHKENGSQHPHLSARTIRPRHVQQLMPVDEKEIFPMLYPHDPALDENLTKVLPSDIWQEKKEWKKIRQKHPVGVISNLGPWKHDVHWKNVSYLNLNLLLTFCAIAYPALLILILLGLTVLVSMCLASEGEAEGGTREQADVESDAGAPSEVGFHWQSTHLPLLPKHRLTATSQRVYACWAFFCCSVPSIMVFGIPITVVWLSRSYPQEIVTALTLVTSVFVFVNGSYMLLFAGRGMLEISMAQEADCSRSLEEPEEQVRHWVILPNYKEDIPILCTALQSVADSEIAKSSIGIVLAMEAREDDAREKAETLRRSFQHKFRAITIAHHPANLPNDPPGKASNTAWAFKELCRAMKSKEEMSRTIITVADADSEFSPGYFASLSRQFMHAGEEERYKKIWQSPVFHVKNYHRLPPPVMVGTIFTGMQELAALSDPNAFRLPYSTYSLSMDLARQVGGWDPEWIAEDYHMGIKCFIMTLGQTSVEPVLLATTNYVPEVIGSWWGTCKARWTQAKRHALGFSDMSYYFMMLPLVFRYLSQTHVESEPKEVHRESSRALRAYSFLKMVTYGSCLLTRLVNCHVVIGVLSTYGVMEFLLKALMLMEFPEERNIGLLTIHLGNLPFYLMMAGMLGTAMCTSIFLFAYEFLKHRMEGEPTHSHWFIHWVKLLVSVGLFAPFYFLFLGIAIWQAAIAVLTRSSFEYEVAPKPVLPPTGKMLEEAGKQGQSDDAGKQQQEEDFTQSDEASTVPPG